jgi:rubrerythrin
MSSDPSALTELRDHTSRKRFLRLGGAGLAGALAVTLSACGSSEDEEGGERGGAASFPTSDPGTKSFGEGDLGIANYALTLEYLETEFYARAADSGILKGEPLEVAKRFGEQEREHVEALSKLIRGVGGKPAEEPEARFPLENPEQILKLAATVEDLGANAYLGQAAFIKDPEILAAALSIHSVEARHAAVLAEVTGAKPSPRAYAEPADAKTVLAAVRPFLAS